MQCLEKDRDGILEDISRWIEEAGGAKRSRDDFLRGLHMLLGGLLNMVLWMVRSLEPP
jgi:hypothetical protein